MKLINIDTYYVIPGSTVPNKACILPAQSLYNKRYNRLVQHDYNQRPYILQKQ